MYHASKNEIPRRYHRYDLENNIKQLYSIMVNGTRQGFFKSTRDLKQGDLLAPTLFILGTELLSRMLNNLTHDQFFNGFYMERNGPQINHLSFADDVIIFTSGTRASL